MTTKKERRRRVAEKRARFDAESKAIGLEAQRRDHLRRERKKYEAEQAAKQKKNAELMRAIVPDPHDYMENVKAMDEDLQGIDLTREQTG